MATLAESFLADLDDLSEEEEEEDVQKHQDEDGEGTGGDVGFPTRSLSNLNPLPHPHSHSQQQPMEEEIVIKKGDKLKDIAKLATTERYQSIMARVHTAITHADTKQQQQQQPQGPLLHSEDDPTYKLLVDCNQLAVDIDNEIITVFNFLKHSYRPKFPELESLVHNPLDYARVVAAIGNEMDVTLIDLDAILPPATVMVVTVTATTTAGEPLDDAALQEVLAACALAQSLDADRSTILRLVQQSMDRIAPNLSAAVGTEIAAQLMGVAGGLHALAGMPACNVQVLGAKRRNLAGFSSRTTQPHQGFVYQCELIQRTPPALRSKAARLVGAKCTLLARMDAHGRDPSGHAGHAMREEMARKIEKWQEPPPAKKGEVLPLPDADEGKKRRRGGKRMRKLKERYGLTELKKQANRMGFNQAEDEFIDGEDVIGMGMIGKEGNGRLRAVAAQQRQKLSAKAAKKFGLQAGAGGTVSGIATSGLTSSLAFTPIQGIELVNPAAAAASGRGNPLQQDAMKDGTESYFSEYSGFRSSKKAKN